MSGGINVPCPSCGAEIGQNCVFLGAGIVMGGGGMIHRSRANLIGMDMKPLADRKPADHGDGVPMCSHLVCPKYSSFSGKCSDLDAEPDAVCVPAVRDIVLNLDAHEDASTPAFDEIAELCGVPQWEYPGQVIRDVQIVVKERDELRDRLRTAEAVRDDARASSQRYLDEKREITAERDKLADRGDELRKLIVKLTNETPFPGELEDCRAARAALIAEVGTLRSQVAEMAGRIHAVIGTEVQGKPVSAAYPPSCKICKDTGTIDTGNNDHPCDCPLGDHTLFNTAWGLETGAQIKARR